MVLAAALAAALFTQADVRDVRRTCRAPASWISMQKDGQLHLRPPPDARYEKVDCILGAIRKIAEKRGAWPNMGFVGNEAPGPGKSH